MKQVYAKVTEMGLSFNEAVGSQTVKAVIVGGGPKKFGMTLHIEFPYKDGMDLLPLTKGEDYIIEVRRVHPDKTNSKLGL